MSKITVEYLDHMGSDLTVANVARVSFNKWKEEFDEKDARLIDYLAKHEHSSPFRHTSIQLRCTGPIWLAAQLKKHQVGMSWNEVSRRYVDDDFEFYVPEYRERPEGSLKQGSGGKHAENLELKRVTHNLHRAALETYERMIAQGVAPEQARGILPQNMMTTWIWTGSLTAFYHLWRLRADGHAQVEAQEFARKVEAAVAPLFPHCWEALTKD